MPAQRRGGRGGGGTLISAVVKVGGGRGSYPVRSNNARKSSERSRSARDEGDCLQCLL